MKARDILMGTRRLFTAGQWTRGTFVRHGERDLYCLVGGLRHIAYGKPCWEVGDPAYFEAKSALTSAIGGDLIRFNDSQHSVEPVIRAIDQAVSLIDRKGTQ